MSKIGQIQALVRNGLFYLTEHAHDEAGIDGFDIYDIEAGILNGKILELGPKKVSELSRSFHVRNFYFI